eukprot:403338204
MNFIQEAISQSNSVKKSTFEAQVDSKVPKRIKNLRYFLKKKRGIIYKQAPRQLGKSKHNTTNLESDSAQNGQKFIKWTVELIFVKDQDQKTKQLLEQQQNILSILGGPSPQKSELIEEPSVLELPQISRIILNEEDMIHEETTLQAFINKEHLKMKYHNEQFNLFITNVDGDIIKNSTVFMKRIEQKEAEHEEGEISDDPQDQLLDNNQNPQNLLDQQDTKHLRAVFRELDKSQKLLEVLRGNIVYEYPTFYVKINQS